MYHYDDNICLSQQLLNELERYIKISHHTWISVSQFEDFWDYKYNISPEEVANSAGYTDLRKFIHSSGRFAIYGTSEHENFYISLASVFPHCLNYAPKPYKRNKRRLIKKKVHKSSQANSTPHLTIHEIKSVEDFQAALREIIEMKITQNPTVSLTIEVVSNQFYQSYKKPIRVVIKNLCPQLKLIDLLRTIPDIEVNQVDQKWKISLSKPVRKSSV
ncbi:MAG: hypothetical protein KFF72_20835 [Arthrospira sp. SH-MAG29]|nr:hypothetical protein [Arthrospira sp. SH-MAG29]MBS0018760.1 hypothetical protein [Arthrospira sp. SH-MAG29]